MSETDNGFFKDYISRLSLELLICQGNIGRKLINHQSKIDLPPCLLSEEIISPLFFAYDMRIEQLHSVIIDQGTHLDLVTQRISLLLSENEKIRSKNAELIRMPHNNLGALIGEDKEKELLIQQSDLLIKELESINNELVDRDKKIDTLSLEIKDKSMVICQYETKLKLFEKVHKKANMLRKSLEQELSTEKCSVEGLKHKVRDLLSEDSRRAAALHAALTESKECEIEAVECSQQIMTSLLSTQELQEKLLSKSKDLDSLNDRNLQLSETLQHSNDRCQTLQRSIIAKDRQLEECHKAIELFQKDNASSQLKMKELDTLCNVLQKELDRLVSDQTESTDVREEDIRLIVDAIERNDQGHCHDGRMSELNRHVIDLEIQVGQLTREKENMKLVNSKLQSSLDKEREKFEAVITDLSHDLKETSSKLIEEKHIRNRIERDKEEVECQLRMIQAMNEKINSLLNEEKERHQSERDEWKRIMKAMEDRMNVSKQNLASHVKQLEAEKILLAKKLDELNLHRDDKIFYLESKVEQAGITNADLKKQLDNLEEYHKKILMDALSEKKMVIANLDKKLSDSQASEKELVDRMRKLIEDCDQMSLDRLHSTKIIEDKDRIISDLSSDLAVSQRKLAIITKQLCDNVEDQRERIQREYELKAEIQRFRTNNMVTKMIELG